MTHARALVFAAVLVALFGLEAAARRAAGQGAAPVWYKGNTHTHTLNSDGDSTPDEVVRWYREHRYHFLVLTDHNFVTSVDALNALHGAAGRFVVIPGEEVTDRFGDKPIHVNGLNPDRQIAPQGGSSVADVLQRNVDAIRRAAGVPHVNHPNFGWAVTAEDLRGLRNVRLFEIYNGHPMVNNRGGGGAPGLEEMWDTILSGGTLLYGVAVDDAHTFKQPGNPAVAGPGRGWIAVRAPQLDARALLDGLERGDFYASTGVELLDYQVTSEQMTIAVRKTTFAKYRIQFVGRNGVVLQEALDSPATYRFTGGEGYVRGRVLESNGAMAWTQPVMR